MQRSIYGVNRPLHMGWLRVVGSLKLQVSFAKEPYKTDDILQKRPIILRSPLILAILDSGWHVFVQESHLLPPQAHVGVSWCIYTRKSAYTHAHVNTHAQTRNTRTYTYVNTYAQTRNTRTYTYTTL